jgi:pimeloyl-ACP methyl ester carboxylesterase
VTDAILVSHSVATSMALRLAYRHPDHIRAVVSLEGGPAEEVSTPGFRRAMMLAPLLKLFGGTGMIRGKVHGMLVERSANPAWVTDEIVAGYVAGAARDMDATLDALSQMSKAREPELLAPRLGEVRCPVRLVLGEAPHKGGPSDTEVRLLQASLASFSISRVPGSGNFLFEEAPVAVVDAVDEMARAPRGIRRGEN